MALPEEEQPEAAIFSLRRYGRRNVWCHAVGGTCVAAGTLTGSTYFSGAAVGHALVFATIAAEDLTSRP